MRYLVYLCIICAFKQVAVGQSQGVTNSQTKLRPNQIRWAPTDATLDSVYIIRADTATGEPGWYLVTLGGGGGVADTTLAGDVVGGLNSTFVRKINGVTVENKTPQNREVLQYDGTKWTPDSIDLADLPTLAQSVLLGRTSASTGAPQSITLGTGLTMSGTTLSNSAPDQTVTISGATGTYPNFTVTPTTPGGSSGQVQYNNAGAFGALDSVTVVSNPDRVGIGVPIPTARLDIQGSGSTSATNAFRVRNSSGTNLLTIRNDGNVTAGTATATTQRLLVSNDWSVNNNTQSWLTVKDVWQGSEFNIIPIRIGVTNTGFTFATSSNGGSVTNIMQGGSSDIASLVRFSVNCNTVSNNPSLLINGTGYSGGTATTTKPTLLIEPTGTTSTGWSTSGTKLGVNAESGFGGNLLDLQLNGSSKVYILSSGAVIASNYMSVPGALGYNFNGRAWINCPSDGVIGLNNNAINDFNRLQFGGTTSSFPAIKRNGAGLDIRLADDSGYGAIQSLYDRFGSGSPESVVTAPVGAVYHRTDGGAGTSFYVKESGTGNTGWVGK